MSFSKAKEQYVNAISNQLKRRNRQGRDFFTKNEQKAIEYHGKAVNQIQKLGDNNARETQEVIQETEAS